MRELYIYVILGLISIILTVYSIYYLRNKSNNRGITYFLIVLIIYLVSTTCFFFFLISRNRDESYEFLLITFLAKFIAIQSIYIFSKSLRYGKDAKIYNNAYVLGLIQIALSTTEVYRNNFLTVTVSGSSISYNVEIIFIVNDILSIIVVIMSYRLIYQMLSNYKKSFLISSVIIVAIGSLLTIHSMFGIVFPLLELLKYFIYLFNIMLFVFILEKLYIDSNETDSDVLEFVKASYVIVDSNDCYVDSSPDFNLFDSSSKYRTFSDFMNDILEVEDNIYTIKGKFYRIIEGGLYNDLKHDIYYFQDVTSNFDLKKSYYSKYLVDTLTGCNTRYNLIENYKYINDSSSYIVAYFDIDSFKQINDTYSHEVGDIFIKHFSSYLVDTYGFNNVYRLCGDEFVVITNTLKLEDFIPGVIKRPKYKGINIDIEYSVGAVNMNEDSNTDIHNYLQEAEKAMYTCKNMRKRGR